jgi:hypothetical protein
MYVYGHPREVIRFKFHCTFGDFNLYIDSFVFSFLYFGFILLLSSSLEYEEQQNFQQRKHLVRILSH